MQDGFFAGRGTGVMNRNCQPLIIKKRLARSGFLRSSILFALALGMAGAFFGLVALGFPRESALARGSSESDSFEFGGTTISLDGWGESVENPQANDLVAAYSFDEGSGTSV